MPNAHNIFRTASAGLVVALALSMATAGALTGCSEEPPPPPPKAPPPPPPPPPPEKPAVTPIAQLMKELGISNKIRLPEDKAPATEPERVAVLKFFDGFAKSDVAALKGALSEPDGLILELMDKMGSFKDSTQAVTRVDLVTGSVGGETYAWADFQSGELHQWQLWKFKVTGEARKIDTQVFESYAQPENVYKRIVIKGDRGEVIPAWVKLVADDLLLANQPDEILKPYVRKEKVAEATTEAAGGGGPVGAPPMRRKPPADPIPPPDFKPGGN
jgi:hypothetical protein